MITLSTMYIHNLSIRPPLNLVTFFSGKNPGPNFVLEYLAMLFIVQCTIKNK